ncbi:molecular chaperone [Salmonella enterica subsp. salamae]|nr:molecular chaperone [Salmonella enterica subsp. salamae]ECJ2280738.1 molecular chaperone [Salmonella enterica subsp. salamae]HCC0886635.1 molecular chaperone [Salmonella enterica]
MFRKYILLGLALLAGSPVVHAGVVIGGTRFIFDADKPGITFEVNNTASNRYLVMSKILDEKGNTSGNVPFVITPPLFPLNAGHSNIIRILRVGGDLPDDRESLFWLSVASIPETQSKQPENSLQVAIRSRMKLFYRPTGLKGKEEDAYRQLVWKRTGGELSASNPTPYYVTLFNLKIGGHAIDDAGMVAPFASKTFDFSPTGTPYNVQWQTINDYGRVMPAQQATPN